jgi:SAM-dependent methyltransferase
MSDTVHHPVFARFYARLSPHGERAAIGEHRREALAGLRGRVVEVGAGNGLNFAHYPGTVTEVLAVEPEPYLRRLAERAAPDAPVPVRVVDGVADALPAEDGSFDAAVASLVLCSVPSQERALAELHRVLRPGGELRFYEHVAAGEGPLAVVQRGVDRLGIWPALFGGCHTARDTVGAIEQAGFAIEAIRRLSIRAGGPVAPHAVGTARRR